MTEHDRRDFIQIPVALFDHSAAIGLKVSEVYVCLVLFRLAAPNATEVIVRIRDLAAMTGLSRGTVTSILSRLVHRGLLIKRQQPIPWTLAVQNVYDLMPLMRMLGELQGVAS